MAAMLVATLLVAVAAFGRASSSGFDLTDEAFYLLDARHPEDQFAAPRLHWVLTAPLFRVVGGDLSLHRMAGLLLLCGAGALLAIAVSGLLEEGAGDASRFARRVAAAAVGAAASATFYAFAVRTPGYNWASLLLTTSTLALIAWSAGRHRRWWWSVAGGAVAGLSMLPKLSTGLLLAASGVVACAAIGAARGGVGGASRRTLGWIAGGWLGIGCGLGVLWLWGDPIDTFRAGAEMLAPTALYGDLATRLRLETTEFLVLWWRDAWIVVAGAAVLALGVAVLSRLRRRIVGDVLAAAGLPAAVVVFGFMGAGWDGVPDRSRMVLVAATLVAASWIPRFGLGPGWRAPWRDDRWIGVGMVSLIVLTPLMTAAGTGNADFWRFASFGFWLLAAALPALRGLTGSPAVIAVAGSGLVATVAFASTLVVRAADAAPYRPPADATGVVDRLEVYPGSGEIEIDRGLAKAIRDLRGLATEADMSRGQDILACFDMPGLVLALDGRAPGTSWLFSGYLRSDLAAERALASVPADRRRSAWILVRRPQRAEGRRLEGATPDPARLLASIGREFPGDYRLVGSVDVPFYDRTALVEIWKPRRDEPPSSPPVPLSSPAAAPSSPATTASPPIASEATAWGDSRVRP